MIRAALRSILAWLTQPIAAKAARRRSEIARMARYSTPVRWTIQRVGPCARLYRVEIEYWRSNPIISMQPVSTWKSRVVTVHDTTGAIETSSHLASEARNALYLDLLDDEGLDP